MANAAVESLPPVREQSEDVEMVDDMASVPPETSNGPLSPTTNGAVQSEEAPTSKPRARPKLDMTAFTNPTGSRTGERRKGKSIFGVVLGTLNKAKLEDKQRMASDAAKKRQSIDARLQAKLSREQNIVRKQDQARKDRLAAIRKQEDTSVKSSLITWRHDSHKSYSNFLSTSDVIPQDLEMNDDEPNDKSSITEDVALSSKPTYPPPLFYLPKVLTPSQEAFLARRRSRVAQRIEGETQEWETEKQNISKEIEALKETSESARLEALQAVDTEDQSPKTGADASDVITPSQPTQQLPKPEEAVAPSDAASANPAPPAIADAMDQDEAVEY